MIKNACRHHTKKRCTPIQNCTFYSCHVRHTNIIKNVLQSSLDKCYKYNLSFRPLLSPFLFMLLFLNKKRNQKSQNTCNQKSRTGKHKLVCGVLTSNPKHTVSGFYTGKCTSPEQGTQHRRCKHNPFF